MKRLVSAAASLYDGRSNKDQLIRQRSMYIRVSAMILLIPFKVLVRIILRKPILFANEARRVQRLSLNSIWQVATDRLEVLTGECNGVLIRDIGVKTPIPHRSNRDMTLPVIFKHCDRCFIS